jgi:hypothetical protein
VKLLGLLITKDDDLMVEDWFQENAGRFNSLAVVDGSTSDFTKQVCTNYANVRYTRDPDTHITDQTLRKHGWELLKEVAEIGDWVVICHVDEFFIHDPRDFAVDHANVVMWLPLVVLPHPSEAEGWIVSKKRRPRHLFRHFWWRTTKAPHLEHRMFRYVKEVKWNTEIRKPSCGVIPHNYYDELVSPFAPLYYHYKLFNLDINAFTDDGLFAKSSLGTGVPRRMKGVEDLFFWEAAPFGDGYYAFDSEHTKILNRFGNPPRIKITTTDGAVIVNDLDQILHVQDLRSI